MSCGQSPSAAAHCLPCSRAFRAFTLPPRHCPELTGALFPPVPAWSTLSVACLTGPLCQFVGVQHTSTSGFGRPSSIRAWLVISEAPRPEFEGGGSSGATWSRCCRRERRLHLTLLPQYTSDPISPQPSLRPSHIPTLRGTPPRCTPRTTSGAASLGRTALRALTSHRDQLMRRFHY